MIDPIMPQKAKHTLPPLDLGKETIGQRILRLRKEKGYTQIDLANAIGISQILVSNYERGRLRINHEMVIRFAMALGVSADELLGTRKVKNDGRAPSKKVMRRIQEIESLPSAQQKFILKTIDSLLKAAQK